MRQLRLLAGILAVACTAPMLEAQQSPAGPRAMAAMDSLDRRLDSLVDRMNRAGGNQKVAAMAAVLNELVAQRKAMRGRMQEMMKMMGGNWPAAPSARTPAAGPDTATSDTAHTTHHPAKPPDNRQ